MISLGCFLMTSMIGAFSILLVSSSLLEHRRLEDAEADPQADADQNDRERERDAPAPGRELVARPGAERQDREVRQEQAARHAELRPRRHQAALSVMARPFHREQHRSAPFAADADALNHPQHGQDDRAPDADRVVGRHEGDEEGRDAHAQQRGDQRRLAADAIAVMAEDRGADRPSDEADEIGAECRERRRQRILVGKVELAEDQPGGGAVDEEVVPFDGGADGGRDDGLAQLLAVVGLGHRPVCGCDCHSSSPIRRTPADFGSTIGAPAAASHQFAVTVWSA